MYCYTFTRDSYSVFLYANCTAKITHILFSVAIDCRKPLYFYLEALSQLVFKFKRAGAKVILKCTKRNTLQFRGLGHANCEFSQGLLLKILIILRLKRDTV